MFRLAAHVLGIIAVLLPLPVAGTAQTSTRDRQMISYAKNLRITRLEHGLPKATFAQWFRSVVGSEARIDWEINDCGEQSGNPADGSSINPPLCAQASAKMSDGRQASVLIAIGTHKRGITGPPSLFTMGVNHDGEWKSDRKSVV